MPKKEKPCPCLENVYAHFVCGGTETQKCGCDCHAKKGCEHDGYVRGKCPCYKPTAPAEMRCGHHGYEKRCTECSEVEIRTPWMEFGNGKPANPHRTCGRLDHKMGCDCDLKKPAEQVATVRCVAGHDLDPNEVHPYCKPPLSGEVETKIIKMADEVSRHARMLDMGASAYFELICQRGRELCALVRDEMRGRE
jgi:hypothetical protein